MPKPEEPQYWYFTFMGEHPLHHCCISAYGTYEHARELMIEYFGTKWAFQYPSSIDAGVHEFVLTVYSIEEYV